VSCHNSHQSFAIFLVLSANWSKLCLALRLLLPLRLQLALRLAVCPALRLRLRLHLPLHLALCLALRLRLHPALRLALCLAPCLRLRLRLGLCLCRVAKNTKRTPIYVFIFDGKIQQKTHVQKCMIRNTKGTQSFLDWCDLFLTNSQRYEELFKRLV